ncbi:DUF2892 domain-containing protein [Sulfitobacter sp. F26169L]|uniref:YgaP family membrane protein n=1 Tax=Sulfitobacter sp. F26169L TaxID=2996015 RepID=UPI002260FD28|nr:DUF2892 domain-containing protein [Sulfitobacter sp. F26169L]MCX7568229.1 DUF2892 domain-containing protein [Sulfitobacter sp. F26169L]
MRALAKISSDEFFLLKCKRSRNITSNLGNADRVLRALFGLVIFLAPLVNLPAIWSDGFYAYASMAVGFVLMLASLISFCPVYRIFGMSTCKV